MPFTSFPVPTITLPQLYAMVSVKDAQFGAKGDGITDDTAAITAAIAYATSIGGGMVLMPSGTYVTSATLIIPSNVVLVGSGNPAAPSGGSVGAGGTVINPSVNGPGLAVQASSATITSWGIKNLVINTPLSGGSAVGILLDSCQRGSIDNVGINVQGASQIGLLLRPANGGNCDNNNVNNLIINLAAAAATATGISITSASTSAYNSSFVFFTNTQIFIGANSQTGLYLGLTDSCQFFDLVMIGLTGGLTPTNIKFDYTAGNASWPAATHFYGADYGFNFTAGAGRVVATGVPSGATPNVFYGFTQTNGETLPAVANLEVIGDRYLLVSRQVGYVGNTGAGATVTQTGAIGTAVTINNICGTITTVSNSFTAGTAVQFAVNNTNVAATDTIVVSSQTQNCIVCANGVTTNLFNIAIYPMTSTTVAVVLNFAVIKAVNN